jgi:hypothetical protein
MHDTCAAQRERRLPGSRVMLVALGQPADPSSWNVLCQAGYDVQPTLAAPAEND